MMHQSASFGEKDNSRLDLLIGAKQSVKSKRSQFKIQQMAFMLIALFLFFVLVLLFFSAFWYKDMIKQANKLEQEKASMLAQYISSYSEFSCPQESYCIDSDRLVVLKNKTFYKEMFPFVYIKIRKIYPTSNTQDIECNKANYPSCNLFTIFEKNTKNKTLAVGSFVALCRNEIINNYPQKICELGKIMLAYEVKNE